MVKMITKDKLSKCEKNYEMETINRRREERKGVVRVLVLPSMATEQDIKAIIKSRDYLLTSEGYIYMPSN